MTENKAIRVGTRKSQLAMWQTEFVIAELKKVHPDIGVEIVAMTTTGDKILDSPLHQIGSKSLFTKELEVALNDNRVDFVVHSLKDLPTILPENMVIGAVLERENPRDALVMRAGSSFSSLEELPRGSCIGTSSVRRIAQLRHFYPHLEFKDIRGNLNTRMSKLDAADSPYDALILAYAGMKRLGWQNRITGELREDSDSKPIYYAVGQGALAIECRENDADIIQLLKPLVHKETLLRITTERSLLREMEGGCSVPIAVSSTHSGRKLSLTAVICSVDGKKRLETQRDATVRDFDDLEAALALGKQAANSLFAQGAREILDSIVRK